MIHVEYLKQLCLKKECGYCDMSIDTKKMSFSIIQSSLISWGGMSFWLIRAALFDMDSYMMSSGYLFIRFSCSGYLMFFSSGHLVCLGWFSVMQSNRPLSASCICITASFKTSHLLWNVPFVPSPSRVEKLSISVISCSGLCQQLISKSFKFNFTWR